MSAALPDVFYLDDPQDGASAHLLANLGASLTRGGAAIPADASPLDAAGAAALGEHSLPGAATYAVAPGLGALVDVRDAADVWVRVVLHGGDALTVAAGAWRRAVVAPADVLAPWARAAAAAAAVRDDAGARTTSRELAPYVARLRAPGAAGGLTVAGGGGAATRRFARGSAEEAAADAPFFDRAGLAGHTRALVAELCASFYALGWVTGTGGSISVRVGGRIFMAPSGVQKERMQPADLFVLDAEGAPVYAPRPLPGRPALKLSQCAPLFQHAFALRGAGAAIHTHDLNAVLVTLAAGAATEFRVTHQEMIKGIAGHGFADELVVPIIENTAHEADLADSLGAAMRAYPRSNAVLVRRHGVYVWGADWQAAKTQAECYHYLFEVAVRMRGIGLDPAAVPARAAGIGAATAYGSGAERATTYGHASTAPAAPAAAHAHVGGCCGGGGDDAAAAAAAAAATSAGFHGAAGTSSLAAPAGAAAAPGAAPAALPRAGSYSCVVLDVEGCTTSLSFVADTLFPYAAAHVRGWLEARWRGAGAEEARGDVAALAALSAADVAAGAAGAAGAAVPADAGGAWGAAEPGSPAAAALLDAVCANVAWQMGANRKSGALKALQGHVWRAGYAGGALVGHLFADVAPALRAWAAAGVRVYIYSSGSREAQRLLFAHSAAGDVRPLLAGYFDTAVGGKLAAASYADIALTLGVDAPRDVLFATDALGEAVAAAAAGMQVVVTDRPGNAPLPAGALAFLVATSLLDLALAK